MTEPWKPDVCVYHFPCDDGFASAFAVWKKYGDEVEYIPFNYGYKPEALKGLFEDLKGKNVLVADFSFKYHECKEAAKATRSIVFLDHHDSAERELEHITELKTPHQDYVEIELRGTTDNMLAHFDMVRSGAMLTWTFIHGGADIPPMFDYIQDRDLFAGQFAETPAVRAYIQSLPHQFQFWDKHLFHRNIEEVFAEGWAIKRFYDRRVEDVAETAHLQNFAGYSNIPVVYAPYFMVSDVCKLLLERYPEASFAVSVIRSYGEITYSLRSRKGGFPVNKLCERFGGGGHQPSAGFRVPAA